ncbi:hypothetical protein [Tunturiibacter lichenicola]|jgi:hypothetical protein|uniref:hypothetical protein n=1 Tax=Tunturiibacter lichenicola TaxID=2051959 RepID=UPI0021B36F63|nr:hypothetical protein [Edaphobacter lichenicola]
MTSTKPGSQIGGYRREVDYQKLGPALLISSSLVLAIRTARWEPMQSDGLANIDWEKEVEHSVRIAKIMLSHLTSRYPDLFQSKDVAWYVATDEEVPK